MLRSLLEQSGRGGRLSSTKNLFWKLINRPVCAHSKEASRNFLSAQPPRPIPGGEFARLLIRVIRGEILSGVFCGAKPTILSTDEHPRRANPGFCKRSLKASRLPASDLFGSARGQGIDP